MSKQTTKRSRADSSDNTVNSTSGSPNPAKVSTRALTSIMSTNRSPTTSQIAYKNEKELADYIVIVTWLKHRQSSFKT